MGLYTRSWNLQHIVSQENPVAADAQGCSQEGPILSFPTFSLVHCPNRSWINIELISLPVLPVCFKYERWKFSAFGLHVQFAYLPGDFEVRSGICSTLLPHSHCTEFVPVFTFCVMLTHTRKIFLFDKSDLMYLLPMATYLSVLQPFKVQRQLKQHKFCS